MSLSTTTESQIESRIATNFQQLLLFSDEFHEDCRVNHEELYSAIPLSSTQKSSAGSTAQCHQVLMCFLRVGAAVGAGPGAAVLMGRELSWVSHFRSIRQQPWYNWFGDA